MTAQGRDLSVAVEEGVGLLEMRRPPANYFDEQLIGQVVDTALAWARSLVAAAPLAVRSIRATLRADLPQRVRDALEHELAEQARLWTTRDCAEGIAASLERRSPVFTGE